MDFNFRTRNLLYRSQPALCLSFLAERMETFHSEHFCMRGRIFGNDRRNDCAFAFCDETIYRKKAQVIFFQELSCLAAGRAIRTSPSSRLIPSLRSGTAPQVLLSLSRRLRSCASAHVKYRVLRSKISQHTVRYANP